MNIPHIIECFSSFFCDTHRSSCLSYPHFIIHPVQEWSGSHCQFWFCFVISNDELLWPCCSLRVHNGLLRFIMRFFLFHNNVLGLLMKETCLGLVCLSPRSYNGLHRSTTHPSVSFPLLRRPSSVIIPLWVACWEGAFHELLRIIVIGSFHSVYADFRSPWSLLSLSFRTPGILISMPGPPRVWWSWRRHDRRHPRC